MLDLGSQAVTTDSARRGKPHIRSRTTVRVPTRIGRVSGRYSRMAGSMMVAVVGSARTSKAYAAGTSRSVLAEIPMVATTQL